MTIRRIIPLLAAALLTAVSAQPPPASVLSAASYLELQAAAAFTDGFQVPCRDVVIPDEEAYFLCVDTSETPWDAAQLRDWSDYGLDLWTIYQGWTLTDDGDWTLTLFHETREEMVMIAVAQSGNGVVYIAIKF